MYKFIVYYLSIYLVFEDRLSYYHLRSIFLGRYATIDLLLALGIFGQAMSWWIDIIFLHGHHSNFCYSRCFARCRFRKGCEVVDIVGIGSASSIVWA